MVIFVGYLLLVSRSADIRRVFQYHGAEHMTIHALEHEDPLDVEHVRQYPTAHQRCGTEFLVIFIILSILMFSLLAGQNLLVSIVGRILLVPVIASLAYEILRIGARHRHRWWIRWLFLPGIWLQAHHHQAARRLDDRGRHRVDAARHWRRTARSRRPAAGTRRGGRSRPRHAAESAPDQLAQ